MMLGKEVLSCYKDFPEKDGGGVGLRKMVIFSAAEGRGYFGGKALDAPQKRHPSFALLPCFLLPETGCTNIISFP